MLNWLTRRALSAWRRAGNPSLHAPRQRLPTECGSSTSSSTDSVDPQRASRWFRDLDGGEDVLVRVHSSCVTGGIFLRALRLRTTARHGAAAHRGPGRGVLLYLSIRRARYQPRQQDYHSLQTSAPIPWSQRAAPAFPPTGAVRRERRMLVDLGSIRRLLGNSRAQARGVGDGLSVSEAHRSRFGVGPPRRYLRTRRTETRSRAGVGLCSAVVTRSSTRSSTIAL
jgi:GTP cyclohydrolase II